MICLFKSKGCLDKKNLSLYGILICYMIIFTFVFKNKYVSDYIDMYFLAFLGFVMIVYGVVEYYKNASLSEIWLLLKMIYFLIFTFLFVCYVLYFDNFIVLRNPSLLIETAWTRTRSSFGFVHANTTAGICTTCIYLRLLLITGEKKEYIKFDKQESVFLSISSLIVLIMLISTASRGTIIAIVSLYCCKWYLGIDDKFVNKTAIKLLKPALISIVISLLILNIYLVDS